MPTSNQAMWAVASRHLRDTNIVVCTPAAVCPEVCRVVPGQQLAGLPRSQSVLPLKQLEDRRRLRLRDLPVGLCQRDQEGTGGDAGVELGGDRGGVRLKQALEEADHAVIVLSEVRAYAVCPLVRSMMIVEIPKYAREKQQDDNGRPLPPVSLITAYSTASLLETVLGGEPNLHHLSRTGIALPGPMHRLGSTSLLFTTANACYDNHEPLSLAPEVIWFTILSEIARVVKADPVRFGHLYSRAPDERQIAQVRIDGFVYGQPNDWAVGIAQFLPVLRGLVPDGLLDNTVPAFSTATPESDAVLLLAFMDGASAYYDYRMTSLCGIPRVRLEGTADDWLWIVYGAQELAGVFAKPLGPYFDALIPVLTQIADTVAGKMPRQAFWQAIYKRDDESGGPHISGWMTTLLAHTVGDNFETTLRDPASVAWATGCTLTSNELVSHMVRVPFIWEYLDTDIPMEHVAGIIGVERDDAGFFSPRLGFAVNEPAATSPPRSR
ncbi:MAG: hypothetical protein ACI8RZ_005137 [Myxococcota bacterium]